MEAHLSHQVHRIQMGKYHLMRFHLQILEAVLQQIKAIEVWKTTKLDCRRVQAAIRTEKATIRRSQPSKTSSVEMWKRALLRTIWKVYIWTIANYKASKAWPHNKSRKSKTVLIKQIPLQLLLAAVKWMGLLVLISHVVLINAKDQFIWRTLTKIFRTISNFSRHSSLALVLGHQLGSRLRKLLPRSTCRWTLAPQQQMQVQQLTQADHHCE